jgi:predicted short-subunit dehydrogenase-like oxidoreductase (DUF2520 family)
MVGAGRAARTLARLWREAGVFAIGAVSNRSLASAQAATTFIGSGVPSEFGALDARASASAQVVMIGVTDSEIEGVAQQLATRWSVLEAGSAPAVVFHLSGALPAQSLAGLRSVGAAVASLHPVTSFADPAALLVSFASTPCALEGDAAALAVLEPALARIGAKVFRIDGNSKLAYHAGAVFASNYLVCLLDAATQAYAQAGIDAVEALALARPLIRQTLENVFAHGSAAALSGPIARGDVELVLAQHAALAVRNQDLARLYQELGRHAARLAQRADPWEATALPAEPGGRV